MSETSPVKTVKREVETVLRITAEAYAVQTEAADDLVKGNAEFHEAVLAVLNDIIEAYVAPEPVFEDPEIRVGDTVRIIEAVHDDTPVGTEFVVTGIVSTEHRWIAATYYVTGDPEGHGIWNTRIEKVHA